MDNCSDGDRIELLEKGKQDWSLSCHQHWKDWYIVDVLL